MNRLKELRLENDLKQSDLGELLGVRDSVISRYERGIIGIPIESLQKLSEIFHVSTDYILCLTAERNPRQNSNAGSLAEPILSKELQQLIQSYESLHPSSRLVLKSFLEDPPDKTVYELIKKIQSLPPHAREKVIDYLDMVAELESSKNSRANKNT